MHISRLLFRGGLVDLNSLTSISHPTCNVIIFVIRAHPRAYTYVHIHVYIITIVTEVNGPLLCSRLRRGIRDDNRLHFARSRFELNSKLHPAAQPVSWENQRYCFSRGNRSEISIEYVFRLELHAFARWSMRKKYFPIRLSIVPSLSYQLWIQWMRLAIPQSLHIHVNLCHLHVNAN